MQKTLSDIRKNTPLVLNLTNYVTMDFMANCLLSLGASPIMSCAEEELEDLIPISKALNINVGTLDDKFIRMIHKAIKIAKTNNIPIIFDPVGCGASKLRTKTAREIILNCNIIKGNASEIISLQEDDNSTRGVDSIGCEKYASTIAKSIAQKYGCTVAISGKTDFIIDANHQESLHYNVEMMKNITGMGCILTAVISCFRAVVPDDFEATFLAIKFFTSCGEKVANTHNLPSSFKIAFIDELYRGENYV